MLLVYMINLLLLDHEITKYFCDSKFIIELDKTANIQCGNEYIELNYDEFSYTKFYAETEKYQNKDFANFVNKSIDMDSYESNMANIASSIKFYYGKNLIFTDFVNENAILTASKIFDSNLDNIKIWINMSWNNYMNYTICPWVDGKYYNDYIYVKNYFDKITYKSRWRKVCFPYSGYLFYQDKPAGEIKYISTKAFVGGIIAAVLIFAAVVVSLYLIALYQFKKDMEKISDESIEEDED